MKKSRGRPRKRSGWGTHFSWDDVRQEEEIAHRLLCSVTKELRKPEERVNYDRLVNLIATEITLARVQGQEIGIRQAASVAGKWERIGLPPYYIEDLILLKCNVIQKGQVRKRA